MGLKVEHITPYGGSNDKTQQVKQMFDSIAPAYDFMNRAMTFGLDALWRRRLVKAIAKAKPSEIVDLATGTGDIAIAMGRKIPDAGIIGIDLSEGMITLGRRKVAARGLTDRITLLQGDCLNLQLPDKSADAITVAYGVRNFEHLDRGYNEMFRVLRPGGRLFILELSTPVNPIVKPLYKFYTRCIIPTLGRLISSDKRAYSYLPESIAALPQGSDMLRLIEEAGFTDSHFRRMTMGVCTIYTASRPFA